MIPPFTVPSSPYNSLLERAIYIAAGIAFTTLITFVFKNTGGSILATSLYHSMVNDSAQALTLPAAGAGVTIHLIDCLVTWAAVVAVMAIFGLGFKKSAGRSSLRPIQRDEADPINTIL
jgi:hypothetical protein